MNELHEYEQIIYKISLLEKINKRFYQDLKSLKIWMLI